MTAPVSIEIEREDGLGEDNPRFVADGSRWRVEVGGLENFGGLSYDLSTQAYAQYDGSALLRERVPEQDRTLVVAARFGAEAARDEAMGFFIPGREYTVRCTVLGRTRHFAGRQYALTVDLGSLSLPTRVTWTCLSIQPYWLSEDEHGVDVVEARKCRGFPFLSTDLHDGGFIVGMVSHETRLVNAGHAPTYPRFTVTAAGMVSRPTVRVLDASGSAVMDVTMLLDLDAGDVLTLDFEARPTAIELNGANVSHLAKPGSTLAASIGVGEFSIEWSAESGDAAMSVVPSIRERYTGI